MLKSLFQTKLPVTVTTHVHVIRPCVHPPVTEQPSKMQTLIFLKFQQKYHYLFMLPSYFLRATFCTVSKILIHISPVAVLSRAHYFQFNQLNFSLINLISSLPLPVYFS